MKARRAAPWVVAALVASRLSEVRVARRNEVTLRARGAVEHGRAHFPLFFVLHPAWLLGLVLEGGRSERAVRPGWLAVTVLAQPARRWVMRTLGAQFTTRILVVEDAPLVTGGPFRLGRHPGYAVVTVELLAAPLALRAPRTAVLATVANAALLGLLRVPAEDRALASARAASRCSAHQFVEAGRAWMAGRLSTVSVALKRGGLGKPSRLDTQVVQTARARPVPRSS